GAAMGERALSAKTAAPSSAGAARKTAAHADAREDHFEREAERTADAVMNGRRALRPGVAPAPLSVPRPRSDDQDAGPGRELDAATRRFMEARFGYDFGRVRIHTDERAARSARSLHAWAYTSGTSIVFAGRAYDSHSHAARHLLAHELTHIVQHASCPRLAPLIRRRP